MLKGFKIVSYKIDPTRQYADPTAPQLAMRSLGYDRLGCVTYREWELTRPLPGHGPLCVFTDEGAARKAAAWFNRRRDVEPYPYEPLYVVHECEYDPAPPVSPGEEAVWLLRRDEDCRPLGRPRKVGITFEVLSAECPHTALALAVVLGRSLL